MEQQRAVLSLKESLIGQTVGCETFVFNRGGQARSQWLKAAQLFLSWIDYRHFVMTFN